MIASSRTIYNAHLISPQKYQTCSKAPNLPTLKTRNGSVGTTVNEDRPLLFRAVAGLWAVCGASGWLALVKRKQMGRN
jgi:hypothetical protein